MSAVRKAVKVKTSTSQVLDLPLKNVHPDPHQPRKAFDDAKLQALADNIRERGILQPILVRQDGDRTLIVDGERRWRAAKLAKLATVPTLRVDMGTFEEHQIRLDQVAVNQLREQLKPMDLARVLRDMRDRGKTVNDIAAMLAKQGHEAMKPAQITATAALVDLPTWAHEMIDGDQAEAAGLGKLLPILTEKGVEKSLRKRLEQFVGYRGKVFASEVVRAGREALEGTFAELDRIQSWNSNPVLFAWKTRCKGCEHLLQFEGFGYCRNAKLFKEHQAEAKAEGLLPGGKRPEKPKPVTGKAAEKEVAQKTEQRERSLTDKARDYLHGCLTVALLERVGYDEKLQLALVIWRALKNPGSNGARGAHILEDGISCEYQSLEQLAISVPEFLKSARFAAALDVLNELPWRETHALARQLFPKLEDAWTLDAAFLDLFRKAELVHLAVKHECNPGDGRLWDRMKGDDMKAALLTQPERLSRPSILVDLYEGEIGEPYKPWRPGDDDDIDGANDDDDLDDESDDEEATGRCDPLATDAQQSRLAEETK